MDIFYITLILITCALVGYLCGSVSSGIIISKIKYKKDPRDYGSHNSGGTNVGRTFGLKVGLLTILCDMIKTIIPMYACYLILKFTGLNSFHVEQYGFMCAGLFALIGHCYPIWHNFKGGKAVSTFAGIIIASSWILTIIGITTFLVIFLISHKVSLGSIITALTMAFGSLLLMLLPDWFMNFGIQASLYFSITLLLCTALLIYRHRANIVRLIHHEENEIHLTKKKEKVENN